MPPSPLDVERPAVTEPPERIRRELPLLDRVNAVRRAWWRSWPLVADDTNIALWATVLDFPPEFAVSVGDQLPGQPVGLVVRYRAHPAALTLFGILDSERDPEAPNSAIWSFADPVVRVDTPVSRRPRRAFMPLTREVERLTAWYSTVVRGMGREGAGRPRRVEADEVVDKLKEMHGEYRRLLLDGSVSQPLTLADVADALGVSSDTVARRLGDSGTTFSELVAELDRKYDSGA